MTACPIDQQKFTFENIKYIYSKIIGLETKIKIKKYPQV